MAAKGKKITRIAKLQFPAGGAKPGPALAGLGIDMPGFTREFNDATRDRQGDIVPVVITAFEDRSYSFELKTTPTSVMIKKALKLEKGATKSGKETVGSISKQQLKEIAEYKMQDLNTLNIDMAISMVEGTAKNMGVKVLEEGESN